METDTKKKRGRPRTVAGEMARIDQDQVVSENGLRAATNMYYSYHLILELYGKPEKGSFFRSPDGKLRRLGIAEQIGRMYEDDLITEQEARDLVEQSIQEYESGATVKEIEQILRLLRLNLKNRAYTA